MTYLFGVLVQEFRERVSIGGPGFCGLHVAACLAQRLLQLDGKNHKPRPLLNGKPISKLTNFKAHSYINNRVNCRLVQSAPERPSLLAFFGSIALNMTPSLLRPQIGKRNSSHVLSFIKHAANS